MEGKNFLGMDREMQTAVGVSYVIWLAMLIAVVAMLNSLNSRLVQIDVALKGNLKALEANGEAIEANGKALESVAAQLADSHAALDTLSAKIKKLISMILELLDELDATGGDDVETKVETYRAR